MNSRVFPSLLAATCALSNVVGATEEPHRTGWWVGVGPVLQRLGGSDHEEMMRRDVRLGYGGQARIGYFLTRHWGVRIAAATARHQPVRTSVVDHATTACASLEVAAILSLERLDLYGLALIGLQRTSVDYVDHLISLFPKSGARAAHGIEYRWRDTYDGSLGGGGAGVRCWLTPRISIDGDGTWRYVHYRTPPASGRTGSADSADDTIAGTAWGVTVMAAYHL